MFKFGFWTFLTVLGLALAQYNQDSSALSSGSSDDYSNNNSNNNNDNNNNDQTDDDFGLEEIRAVRSRPTIRPIRTNRIGDLNNNNNGNNGNNGNHDNLNYGSKPVDVYSHFSALISLNLCKTAFWFLILKGFKSFVVLLDSTSSAHSSTHVVLDSSLDLATHHSTADRQ